MADTGAENIGGVSVSITGDYSPLQAAFASAQDIAQQAGADIADALVTGAEGAGNLGDELSDQLGEIGPAADEASAGLGEFSDAAGTAGESAEEAGGALGEMAEQMLAVGEALVITEGLTELGSEALTAADGITKASIALTTITGSGDTAKETIEGLEQIGQSDGLAMPSLLSAATRMTAILGPSADVTEEIKLIADGAAVMGTDIETATTKFDQLATAGTASARTLTALGISLGSLAAAYNSVIEGSDETATSVAASFKALDQSQRIEVLNAALSTLGGTAQQVAEQTFGGQWQQLANSWESLMVEAGQALLPFMTDLTDFLKLDVVPFVQSLVDAWKSLPQPMQDASVALTLVGAALVPLTGALAAGTLAVGALSGVLPALNGLLETLGITSGETAIEETAAATATEALGVASTAAGEEMAVAGGAAASVGAVVGGVLAAALVAGAALWSDYKTRIDAAQESVKGIIPAFDAWLQQQVTGASTNQALEAAQQKVNDAFANGLISAKEYQAMLAQLDVTSKSLISTWAATLPQISIVSDATEKATSNTALLSQALADAQANLTKVSAGYQTGANTAAQLLSAQTAVTSAQQKLNDALGPTPGSLAAIDTAAQNLAASTNNLVSAQQVQENAQAILASSLDLANTAYATSVDRVAILVTHLQDANAAYAAGQVPRSVVIDAEQALQKAYAESEKASEGLATTVENYADTMAGPVKAGELAAFSGLEQIADAIGPAMSSFLGLDGVMKELGSAFTNEGVQIVNLSTGPLVGLQSALAEAKQKVADLSAQMADGANVGQQYEKALTAQMNAQIALDAETAVLATGVSTATDTLSLLTVAVAAAQAKVDDLTAAVQNGLPVQAQLLAAQKSLTSEQTALNAAIAAAQGPLAASTAGMTTNTAAANNNAAALNTVATAYQAVGTAATAAAAEAAAASESISSAVAALQTAFTPTGSTSSSTLGSAFGAPAGYGTRSGMGPNGPIVAFYPYPETQMKLDLVQAIAEADAASNPSGNTSTASVDAQALAEAIATLKIDQEFYGQVTETGAQVVTPAQLQAAQTAVTTAQAALTALGAAASVSGGGTTAEAGGVLIDPTQSAGLPTVAGTTTASATAATTTGTLDSSSYGGTYPGVVAHQAAGEVWVVDTSGVANGAVASASSAAASTASTSSTTDATAALAASSTAATVQTAATTMTNVVGALQDLTTTVAYVASVAAAVKNGTSVSGALENVTGAGNSTAGTSTGTGTTAASGSNAVTGIIYSGTGQAAYGGLPTAAQFAAETNAQQVASGQAALPYAIAPTPPGGAGGSAASPLSSVVLNIDMRGAMVGNAAQLQAQLTQAVTQSLTNTLFTSGARLTR